MKETKEILRRLRVVLFGEPRKKAATERPELRLFDPHQEDVNLSSSRRRAKHRDK